VFKLKKAIMLSFKDIGEPAMDGADNYQQLI